MGSPVLENTLPVNNESDGNKPLEQPRYTPTETSTTTSTETKSETLIAATLPLQGNNFVGNNSFGQAAGDAAADTQPQGDGAVNRDKPLSISDIDEIPVFFILDNRPNTGERLAPPVGLHDPDKTTPLQITDDRGRVIATDSGLKGANWSVNKNPETGDIESITYPDGKTRNFKHEGGQLTRIETVEKGADGQPTRTVFSRDTATGKWYAEIGGLKAELPGDIQFTRDGNLSFQMDNQGKWRSERPDGTVLIERTIESGARVAFNDDNTVKQLTRPDQSRVECIRDKGELTQINEIGADGKTVAWSKNGEKWVSNQNPPQERTNFQVSDNGNISYIAADNIKHTITGGGIELNQNPNGSEFSFDAEGRFTDVKDVNGLRVRGIQYHPETKQVTRVQIGSGENGGQVCLYEREGTSNLWRYTVQDGAGNIVKQDRWGGDITVGKDGTYAFREDPSHGRNKDNMWAVYKLDGTQYLLQDNGQGSRAVYDMNRNLLMIERQNGTRLDINRTNGFATTITETGRDGSQVQYTYDPASGTYLPNQTDPACRAIKKLDASGDGTIQITDINGSVYTTNLDGASIVKNADGSVSEVDNQGRVMRTTSKGGDVVRTFNWDQGRLLSVNEVRKGGETRMISGKDMTAGPDGIIRYTDVDGQKLSTTADGSWQAWQNFNGRELLVKAVNPKGHMRTIVRDESGEAISMIDSKPTPQGQQQTEEFRRVHENGRWTDSWAKVSQDGKVTARHNVQILDNGTYNYIDSAGKDKIAKVGDRGFESGFSDSVEEARARLTELMESHLDESQRKRFQIILDRFEKRAQERVEAQTAGGLDQNKSMEEWDQKVAKSYDHLAQMLNPNAPNAQYDIKARARLVENMAFAMAAPVKANDQGNWGCCWMISGVYCGIIQYPDKMCSMLSQLSMEGKYTDVNGKTWDPPKHLLKLTSQGGNWTIENCGRGQRSPVSEILTSVASYLSNDGRRMDRGAGGGSPQGCNHAMKLITGDTFKVTSERSMTSKQMQQELLTKGSFVCIMPGHMYLGALEKHGNEWKLVSSLQHGDGGRRVNGTVTDLKSWTVSGQRMRYNPDIDLPECKDQPIGPAGPGGGWGPDGGGGGGRWFPRFRPRWFPRLFGESFQGFDRSLEDQKWRDLQQKRREEEEYRVKVLERIQEEQEERMEASDDSRNKRNKRNRLKQVS